MTTSDKNRGQVLAITGMVCGGCVAAEVDLAGGCAFVEGAALK